MRVLHIIPGLETGGAELMLARLVTALGAPTYEHIIITLRSETPLAARIRASGVSVRCLGLRPGMPSPFSVPQLRYAVRRSQPEIVHGWMYHGNFAAMVATMAWKRNAPVLWSIRHSLYDLRSEKRSTQLVILAGAYLSRYPFRVLYCSEISAAQHGSIGYRTHNSCLIPNGFDCDTFKPNLADRSKVRSELEFKDSDIVIGLIARYHPMKDHANFLRAAAILRKKHPHTRFLLVGREITDQNPVLTNLVRELALNGSVRLLGERSDIPRVTAALDIAASSSWAEAFSNSIGEAMACAVPCVATDVGDTRKIIGDVGFVVPPRDAEALAAGWCTLIERGRQNREALGMLARQRILHRYSLAAVAQEYAQVYARVRESFRI